MTDEKRSNGFDAIDLKENGSVKPDKDPKTCPMTKWQIIRNLLVVSFGFLCLFTSFQSLSNLQSTLNKEDGLGTSGLAILYGALVVSCMFLPPVIVARLGCKWTIAFSMVGYIVYMAANLYAVWATMIPASIIIGLCAAPLWSAKCTYLTQIGVWYASMTGQSADALINRFFGVFFMAFQTSQIWGNLISSTIFSKEFKNGTNETMPETCGADFCPSDAANNSNLETPESDLVYTVCGIYLGFGVLAFISVSLLLQPIQLDKEDSSKRKFSPALMIATFKHWWKSDEQKLLMIITIYSGLEQGFILSDYTKSYVSCVMGIRSIGYVMICYGVVDAACSFGFGRLVQHVGHIPFFIFVFLLHGGLQITLLVWHPTADLTVLFYVIAGLWGMGDAIIQTQVNALYGYLFTDNTEAAFANYRLWESIGFILAFAYGDFVCTNVKLYVCLAFLTVGIALYGAAEVVHRRKKGGRYDM